MPYSVLIINGPEAGNQNDGSPATQAIRDACARACEQAGVVMDFRRAADPEEAFAWLARDSEGFDGMLIGPGGFLAAATERAAGEIAAMQLLAQLGKPVIEVYAGNIFRKGGVRTRPWCRPEGHVGLVCGLGVMSYVLAVRAIVRKLQTADAA